MLICLIDKIAVFLVHVLKVFLSFKSKVRLAVKMTNLRYKTNFHWVNNNFPA